MENDTDKILNQVTNKEYKYGFVTDVETEIISKGLNEEIIRIISAKKNEPDWLLEFRLKAFKYWQTLSMPNWAHLRIPKIDYQDIIYYAAPKKQQGPKSLDEVDPELLKTFDKLGIPLEEQKHLAGMAVDAVMDSISVKTTFKETLAQKGIIFSSFSEAVQHHPDLVKQYLGKVVPVLLENVSEKNSDMLAGYTDTMKLVNVKASKDMLGKIVDVKITDVKTWSMDGEIA